MTLKQVEPDEIYIGDTPAKCVYVGSCKVRPTDFNCCFTFTGTDQTFVAPTTGYYCAIVLGGSTSCNCGGCSTGCLYLHKGYTYSVMAGGNGVCGCYGFGGGNTCSYDLNSRRGAGLSGVFCGDGLILYNHSSRAMIIAGGAGGKGGCNTASYAKCGCGGGLSGGGNACACGGTQTGHGANGSRGAYQFCGGTGGGCAGGGGGGWWGGNGACGSGSLYRGGGGGSGYVGGACNGVTTAGQNPLSKCGSVCIYFVGK